MTAGRPFLWDDPCGPPLATYPNDRPGEGWRPVLRRTDRVVPIRSCSRWGLPCRRCCQRRGGLLPHRFTLTPPALRLRRVSSREPHCRRGGLFSVALSLGSPPPDVIRHRFSVEPGLSSPAVFRHVTGAAVQPAGVRYVFRTAGEVNAKSSPTSRRSSLRRRGGQLGLGLGRQREQRHEALGDGPVAGEAQHTVGLQRRQRLPCRRPRRR